MKKLSLHLSLLCLLAFLLILSAACKKEETVEEIAATTEMETTYEPMATDMGTMSTDMGTDMTTSEPMGTDMQPPAGDREPPPPDGEEYPEFPWPPPRASATAKVPSSFLVNPNGAVTHLSDVNRRLLDALERNGYFESSYYAVPKGFALATKMEQINADGTAKKESDRWIIERQPLQKFSLSAYLNVLFAAAPGRYRITVFIVTPYPFSQSRVEITSSEASGWLSGGLDQLPTPIGQRAFAVESYKCTALIYEFERKSDIEDPKLRMPSSLLGRAHLEKAGIWGVLQR